MLRIPAFTALALAFLALLPGRAWAGGCTLSARGESRGFSSHSACMSEKHRLENGCRKLGISCPSYTCSCSGSGSGSGGSSDEYGFRALGGAIGNAIFNRGSRRQPAAPPRDYEWERRQREQGERDRREQVRRAKELKRREEEKAAERQQKFDASKDNLLKEIGSGTEKFDIKGLSDDPEVWGLWGGGGCGGGGGGLELMSSDEPKPTLRHKTGSPCGAAARQVSQTIETFSAEAKNRGYQFLAADVRTAILDDKAFAGMGVKEYNDFHNEALAQIERLKKAKENLLRIKSCIMTKGCSLGSLNLEINQEFKEWLKTFGYYKIKGQFPEGIQGAIARVRDAETFVTDSTQRLEAADEKLISKAAKCLGS